MEPTSSPPDPVVPVAAAVAVVEARAVPEPVDVEGFTGRINGNNFSWCVSPGWCNGLDCAFGLFCGHLHMRIHQCSHLCLKQFWSAFVLTFAKSETSKDVVFFSVPIPCAYTSSPLDGMARNNIFFIYLDTQEHTFWSGSILSYHLIPERKTFWTTLGSNPARQLRKRARYPLCHHLSGRLHLFFLKVGGNGGRGLH